MGRGLYTAKEMTLTKNVIQNAFLMRDFYFKIRTCMKAVDTSVRCSLSKEIVPEKSAGPIQYLWSDEMLTGLMSVALFYRYFRNLL